MAAAANASIVPFVFAGARERLPLGAWRVRPGSVRVVFLPAVSVPGGDAEAVARAKAELRHMAARARRHGRRARALERRGATREPGRGPLTYDPAECINRAGKIATRHALTYIHPDK